MPSPEEHKRGSLWEHGEAGVLHPDLTDWVVYDPSMPANMILVRIMHPKGAETCQGSLCFGVCPVALGSCAKASGHSGTPLPHLESTE